MEEYLIVVECYFDGWSYYDEGPYTIVVLGGVISSISKGNAADKPDVRRAGFLMPGMVEAHCHLFLNGGELDFAKRSAYMKSTRENMLAEGRRSLQQSLAVGITLIRDAGDIHGINLQLREEYKDVARQPTIRCPGKAIRKEKRYGSFMAQEVTDETGLDEVVSALAVDADEIKVLMTGIIDFEAGQVKGPPQFTLEETKYIVRKAKALGRRTFAHCSGQEGIKIALEAGLNSIEHGFFVTHEQLKIMVDKNIAWVPTFAPVHFQWLRPELVGWNDQTISNLKAILDAHGEALEYAYQIGVPVLVGSDAGSYGVEHGRSYIQEIMLMANTGVDLEKILHSATALPRRIWGCDPVDITVGSKAEFVLMEKSPFEDLTALQKVKSVYKNGWVEPGNKPNIVAA